MVKDKKNKMFSHLDEFMNDLDMIIYKVNRDLGLINIDYAEDQAALENLQTTLEGARHHRQLIASVMITMTTGREPIIVLEPAEVMNGAVDFINNYYGIRNSGNDAAALNIENEVESAGIGDDFWLTLKSIFLCSCIFSQVNMPVIPYGQGFGSSGYEDCGGSF